MAEKDIVVKLKEEYEEYLATNQLTENQIDAVLKQRMELVRTLTELQDMTRDMASKYAQHHQMSLKAVYEKFGIDRA
ncbi:hypothetical protein DM01DRAFT_324608 [Hesseltinella vesiculosa]|uniref:Swi5-domain-containing protein n=1 Tax=Hesseltinella vesiculosa TaxID=101127 RepID=A0A1X2GER1_9FUNG|nr:hypothetical protein DM01DRAFT_324608 [Hesseltinella vesiculosa]